MSTGLPHPVSPQPPRPDPLADLDRRVKVLEAAVMGLPTLQEVHGRLTAIERLDVEGLRRRLLALEDMVTQVRQGVAQVQRSAPEPAPGPAPALVFDMTVDAQRTRVTMDLVALHNAVAADPRNIERVLALVRAGLAPSSASQG